jgi:endonuclease YncB( thermonuclease family)
MLLSLITISSAQCQNEIRVVGVIDGDTLKAVIVGFPDPLHNVSIRVMGVDTPEERSKCPNEKARANLAKAFVQEQLKMTQHVTLKNLTWDKYGGRILAEVFFDGRDLSQLLLEKHFAVPYHGEKKSFDWCSFVSEEDKQPTASQE